MMLKIATKQVTPPPVIYVAYCIVCENNQDAKVGTSSIIVAEL